MAKTPAVARNAESNPFHEVLEINQREKVNMREAAYMLAISRVANAMMIRGIYP